MKETEWEGRDRVDKWMLKIMLEAASRDILGAFLLWSQYPTSLKNVLAIWTLMEFSVISFDWFSPWRLSFPPVKARPHAESVPSQIQPW